VLFANYSKWGLMKGTKYEREIGCVEFVCGDCICRVFDVVGEVGIKDGFEDAGPSTHIGTGEILGDAACFEGKRNTNSQQ